MSKCVIKIVGIATGERSDFDGKYVAEYDPTRPGIAPDGRELIAHLVVTPNIEEALKLDFMEAWRLWNKEHGKRPDGRPNKPLTAFHVTFPNAPGESNVD